MKRQSREINIFNMSMLDVICSALGAILILFIVTLQAQNKSHAKAQDFEQKYQRLEEKVKVQQESLSAHLQVLDEQKMTLEQQRAQVENQKKVIRSIASANAKLRKAQQTDTDPDTDTGAGGSGMAIGMCEVTQAQITISVYDHGMEDDDRISVKINKKVISKDITIRARHTSRKINLKKGVNYLNIKALDEGQSPPNTATLIIDPCNNGRSDTFIWEMETGQERNISIVRK